MIPSQSAAQHGSEALTVFQVVKVDVSVQVTFRTPLWALAKEIWALYKALLPRMAPFGVTAHSVRPENGDGSLGGFHLNFWMLDFGALVRIHLDGIEISCNNLTRPIGEHLSPAFEAVCASVMEAHPENAISGYQVSIGIHGQPDGLDALAFLSRFVQATPQTLGKCIGNGVVFYFGEAPPVTAASITVDLSALYPGKVFSRVYGSVDGTVSPERLQDAVETLVNAALSGVGLTLPEAKA